MLCITQENDGPQISKSISDLVSVIIPSRNSAHTIADCLGSILSQSHSHIEIILVDCFSTDSTREIAEGLGARVVCIDGERSSAKNLGAKFAEGKYLYFVDADHTLGPDSVASVVKLIDGVDGVLIRDQDTSRKSRISGLVASRRRVLSNDYLEVAVRFLRKDVFDRLGGFDSELYAGEDLDFQRRFLLQGFKMAYSEATEWHLGSPVDFRGLVSRSLYYAPNYVEYVSKNPLIALKRLSPIRVVKAWKKTDVPSSELLPVVFLGLLSDTFLIIGLLLNRTRHPRTPNGPSNRKHCSSCTSEQSTRSS